MEKKRIIAIGAHPDDIEMGCGGALIKHLSIGDEVFAIILTNGEKGGHAADKKECLNSLKSLGISEENIFFGNFPDGYVADDQKTVEFIESVIRKVTANRVYTHSPHDRHQDHRNCSNAVSSAARKVPEILLFEGPSTLVSFEPHYFIDLEEKCMKKKLECLQFYESQVKKSIVNPKAVEQLAGVIGSRHGSNFAEAFETNHILRRENDL